MLKKIALALVVLVAGFFTFAQVTQPDTFRVERSTTISAPPEVVFALVNDLGEKGWIRWSPWAKRDPNQKNTFSGPATGTGASMSWVGNDEVGEGRMTITRAVPNERIEMKLEFIVPFESTSETDFTLTPADGGVKFVWGMSGTNNLISKVFGLFVDMDTMLGKDFEEGLANLKREAEGEAKRALAERAALLAAEQPAAVEAAPEVVPAAAKQ